MSRREQARRAGNQNGRALKDNVGAAAKTLAQARRLSGHRGAGGVQRCSVPLLQISWRITGKGALESTQTLDE